MHNDNCKIRKVIIHFPYYNEKLERPFLFLVFSFIIYFGLCQQKLLNLFYFYLVNSCIFSLDKSEEFDSKSLSCNEFKVTNA